MALSLTFSRVLRGTLGAFSLMFRPHTCTYAWGFLFGVSAAYLYVCLGLSLLTFGGNDCLSFAACPGGRLPFTYPE